jgi:hypothetical protein
VDVRTLDGRRERDAAHHQRVLREVGHVDVVVDRADAARPAFLGATRIW